MLLHISTDIRIVNIAVVLLTILNCVHTVLAIGLCWVKVIRLAYEMDSSDQIPGDVDYPTEFAGSEAGQSETECSEMTTEVGSVADTEDVNSEEVGSAISLPDNKEKQMSPLARLLLGEARRMNQLRRMPGPGPETQKVENHPWAGPIEPFMPPNPRDKEGFPKLSRKEKELLEQGKDISSSIQVTFGPRYFDLHTGPHSLDDTHVPMHVLDDGRVAFGHNVNLKEVKVGRKWKSPIEEEGEKWTELLEGGGQTCDDDNETIASVEQSEETQEQKDDDEKQF